VNLLDIERFVLNHRLLLNGALMLAEKLSSQSERPRVLAIMRKIHRFLLNQYRIARMVISPDGSRMLPYLGGKIDDELIHNFEVMLSMSEWKSTADVEAFRGNFSSLVEWPLVEFMSRHEERRRYLESVVMIGSM
jgi:hypothetical protein